MSLQVGRKGAALRELTQEEVERYSRQTVLPEIGTEGQKKLLKARVLVVGAGGLGSPALYYLAGAGIGTIGIADSEEVQLPNLQRQFLHTTKDIGKLKTDSAKEKLELLNPSVSIVLHSERLSPRNVDSTLEPFDAVIDGSDNFPTRYIINESCVRLGKPLFHGGIFRFGGQAMSIIPGRGPCLRCVFPQTPPPRFIPDCDLAGVFNVVAGVIGSIQAGEATKFLLGIGELLVGRVLIFDSLGMRFRLFKARRKKDCPVCGKVKETT